MTTAKVLASTKTSTATENILVTALDTKQSRRQTNELKVSYELEKQTSRYTSINKMRFC